MSGSLFYRLMRLEKARLLIASWLAMGVVITGCASHRTAAQKLSAADLAKQAEAKAAAKPPQTVRAKSRNQSYQWAERLSKLYDPAVIQARRDKFVQSHPETPGNIKEAIQKGDLVVGMNPDEARAVYGQPTRVDRDAGTANGIEQWRYGDHMFLSFEHGRLTFWDLGVAR